MDVIGHHEPYRLQYTLRLTKAELECLDDYQHGGTIVGHDHQRPGVSFFITDTFGERSASFCYNHAMGGYVHAFSFADVTTADDLEKKIHGMTLPMTMLSGEQELSLGTVKVLLDYKL